MSGFSKDVRATSDGSSRNASIYLPVLYIGLNDTAALQHSYRPMGSLWCCRLIWYAILDGHKDLSSWAAQETTGNARNRREIYFEDTQTLFERRYLRYHSNYFRFRLQL